MVEASGGRCSPKAAGILRSPVGSVITREGASGFGRGGMEVGKAEEEPAGTRSGAGELSTEGRHHYLRSVALQEVMWPQGQPGAYSQFSALLRSGHCQVFPCLPPFCRPCCPSTCVSLSVKHLSTLPPGLPCLPSTPHLVPKLPHISQVPLVCSLQGPHFPQAVYQPCWAACRPVNSSELLWNFALGESVVPTLAQALGDTGEG